MLLLDMDSTLLSIYSCIYTESWIVYDIYLKPNNFEAWHISSMLIYWIYMHKFVFSWKIIFAIKGELTVSSNYILIIKLLLTSGVNFAIEVKSIDTIWNRKSTISEYSFKNYQKSWKTAFSTYMFCKSIIVSTQAENEITSLSYIDAITNMLK